MELQEKQFDYIIVGAGPSAIGFLYGIVERYSSSCAGPLPFTIAVLERGEGPPHDRKTIVSNRWAEASQVPSSSVELLRATVGSRELDVPVGKGLGGGTNVNACLVVPPAADDFKSWPSPWKETMMPYIHKIQDAQRKHGAIHEFDTSIKEMIDADSDSIRQPEVIWREASFPSFITRIPLSVEKTEQGNYKRKNYYDGILEPLLKANPQIANGITFLSGTRVQRLLFEGRRVAGVECELADGHIFQIQALIEVILSAGALETPALLLASGIGQEEDLKKAGIPSLGCNLPVGYNLRDHIMIPRLVCHRFTSYDLSPAAVQALVYASEGEDRFHFIFFDGSGGPALFAQIAYLLLGRYRVNFKARWLSRVTNFVFTVVSRLTRLLFYLTFQYTPIFYLLRNFVFVTNIALLNPASKGRVSVVRHSKDSSRACRRSDLSICVENTYLSDEKDLNALRRGWVLSEKRCGGWFKQGVELVPGLLLPFNREELFNKYIRASCVPYFHWCCSCPIGRVVDSDLRVKGVDSLRICDASVLATIPSANPALTCTGLGYRLSAMMFENGGKKKDQ